MCMSLPRSVAAVRMADGLTFVIYEFWETEEEWKRLVQPGPYPVPTPCQQVGLTASRHLFLDPEEKGWEDGEEHSSLVSLGLSHRGSQILRY